MSIPNTTGLLRKPTHPGEMLREDYLPDYGLSTSVLAKAIGVSRNSINEIPRLRRSISPGMAWLARLSGNSPAFWLNTQRVFDLWEDSRTIEENGLQIQPLSVP